MSSLTKDDIKKVAKLAHIRLTAEEEEMYAKEVSSILHWVEQLQQVNTDNVPQMTSVMGDVALPLRDDKVTDGNIQEEVLRNAPEADYGCFLVPKVIE